MLSHPLAPDAELCPLEPWQAEEFAAHVGEVRDHLAPWIPWAHTIVDAESAREFLQRYADRQAQDEGRLYGIRVGGKLAGGTLFRTFHVPSGVCEVGVWLDRGAVGRGLVTSAVRAMVDWAVDARGMTRVEWRADPSNTRSVAVAERLGFTFEGVLRQTFTVAGRRLDSGVWAMLADEWREARPATHTGR